MTSRRHKHITIRKLLIALLESRKPEIGCHLPDCYSCALRLTERHHIDLRIDRLRRAIGTWAPLMVGTHVVILSGSRAGQRGGIAAENGAIGRYVISFYQPGCKAQRFRYWRHQFRILEPHEQNRWPWVCYETVTKERKRPTFHPDFDEET